MNNIAQTDINRFIEAQESKYCGYKQAWKRLKMDEKRVIGYGTYFRNYVAWDVAALLSILVSQTETRLNVILNIQF